MAFDIKPTETEEVRKLKKRFLIAKITIAVILVLAVSIGGYVFIKDKMDTSIQQARTDAIGQGQLIVIQEIERTAAIPYFTKQDNQTVVAWKPIGTICSELIQQQLQQQGANQ